MKKSEALAFRRKIEKAASTQTDEDALESIDLYPKWAAGLFVPAGGRYQHNGKLYKVIQAHTTQADWTPDAVPALFAEVSIVEWPEFVQPAGSHDAYMKGDKVTFEGRYYISLIDNNVYSPSAYPAGWELQP